MWDCEFISTVTLTDEFTSSAETVLLSGMDKFVILLAVPIVVELRMETSSSVTVVGLFDILKKNTHMIGFKQINEIYIFNLIGLANFGDVFYE